MHSIDICGSNSFKITAFRKHKSLWMFNELYPVPSSLAAVCLVGKSEILFSFPFSYLAKSEIYRTGTCIACPLIFFIIENSVVRDSLFYFFFPYGY